MLGADCLVVNSATAQLVATAQTSSARQVSKTRRKAEDAPDAPLHRSSVVFADRHIIKKVRCVREFNKRI
ncbi:unnamed protein product, partial [Mesorhabditis spiculigera]